MAKKNIMVFVLTAVVAMSTFAQSTQLQYVDNLSEAAFGKKWPEVKSSFLGKIMKDDFYDVSKIPNAISQAIWRELGAYDLDVGDTFAFKGFGGNIENFGNKSIVESGAILVFLRITSINGDGSVRWTFFAAQCR
jgi:hypothetical protein